MKLNLTYKLLIGILLLAFVLRFYKLGVIPPSLNWDENSNTYNAYSILKTARDEYGNKFPLYNKSFNDYKPPLYMYLTVPAVAVFGLTPFSARLVSVLSGLLTVFTFFFLIKWLFRNNSKVNFIALSSTFFLAISPWHIMLSRIGLEANLGVFIVTLAITLFLFALERKFLLLVSAMFLGLSLYSYHAERIFTPLMLIALVVIFRKEFLKIEKKIILMFFLILLIFTIPLFVLIPKEALSQRFNESSSDFIKENVAKSSVLELQDYEQGTPILRILHNRRVTIIISYFENYISQFDPNFLFVKGDGNLRHHLNNFGLLNIFFLPLILFGIYSSVKISKTFIFLILWLISSAVPASPVTPSPHAIRSFLMVIPLMTFAGIGFLFIYELKYLFKLPLIILTIIIFYSFFRFIFGYTTQYPVYSAFDWQYGYSQAAKFTQSLDDKKFPRIFIDSRLEQAYIFWLFNLKYDPVKYQMKGSRTQFDKYFFSASLENTSDVFVSYAWSFPQDYTILKTIYYPNGTEAIKIGNPR